MISGIKHIFFDLDHTIWDFEANSKTALEKLLAQNKEEIDLDLEEFYPVFSQNNLKFWKRYRSGYISADDLKWKRFWHSLLEFGNGDVDIAKSMSKVYLELLAEGTLLFLDAEETLTYLKNRCYVLHIITNGFEKVQHAKLKNSGIMDYFETVTCSDSIGVSKPAPEIFNHALSLSSAESNNSIYVGDNIESDVMGAYNSGWPVIHFATEPAVLEVNYPQYYHVKKLEEIQKLF